MTPDDRAEQPPAEALLQAALERFEANDLTEAEALCIAHLQSRLTDPDALHLLGLIAQRRGHHELAVDVLAAALETAPRDPRHHHAIALSLRALGRLEDARLFFFGALSLEPHAPLTLTCLGNTLRALGQLEEALESHLNALELQPDLAEAWSNLALTYRDMGRLNEAVEAFRAAVALETESVDLYHNLGNTLLLMGLPADAEAAFRQGLARDPQHTGCRVDLGTALQWQDRTEAAIAAFEAALTHHPDNADAHWNLALALLQRGDTKRGWREFEWRRQLPTLRLPQLETPPWDGSPLEGRTLLIRAEQGLGDTIQFVRFARLAAAGGRVVVEAQAPLRRLLERCDGVDAVVPRGAGLSDFDVQAPMLSLPLLLDVDPAAVSPPYLHAVPERVARWRSRLDSDARLRVGICWQGNPAYRADRRRSLPLHHFVPLARLPGVRLYSLQKGLARDQLSTLPPDVDVIDLGAELDNDGNAFLDTAAVMTGLDLVISSDTAIPHLAGALGLEVWLLLSRPADWRWGEDDARTPWYPRMRLFRQSAPGDWEAVLSRVATALLERLEDPMSATHPPLESP